MDLRLGRLVQIISVLNATDDIRKMEIEWQAKLISKTVAYTIEDAKYRDALVQNIEGVNLRGVDPELAAPGATADTSGDGRTIEDILENGSVTQALARNMRRKGPGALGIP